MASINPQPSPIDLAVQSLTTFTCFKAPGHEERHTQFAADIDEEDLAQAQHTSSKVMPAGGDVPVQQARSEELATEQNTKQPENAPSIDSSTAIDQQSLPKFTPFVRPSSSHENVTTSFAFGRPQPKQLDFSRRKPQDPKPPVPVQVAEPISNAHTPPKARPSSDLEPKATEAATIHGTVPAPTEALNSPQSTSASPTLLATVPSAGSPSCHDSTNPASTGPAARTSIAANPQSSPVPAQKTSEVSQHVTGKPSQIPRMPAIATQTTSSCIPSKVTKRRRKPRPRTNSNAMGDSQPRDANASLSYEDTLSFLVVRYRKEQIQRQNERAALEAKEVELQDLREISNAIYTQLQQVRQREKSQEAELSRFQQIIPQWQNRVKKLSDYVQCLTNDHKTLRDDADEIRRQQKSLQTDKCELASGLTSISRTVDQDRDKTKKVLVEARDHMEMLEQKVSTQEMQLQHGADLLNAERVRSQRLEDEMSRAGNDHQHLQKLVSEQRLIIVEKLDDLMSKSRESQTPAPSSSEDYVKSMLNEAVSLLKGIRKTESMTPDDIRRLDASIRSYAERVTGSVQACEQAVTTAGTHQQGFASEFQERLQVLSANIAGEHVWTERVTDLREVKATLKERLQATEATLAETRRQSNARLSENQLQTQKIAALEIETANLRIQSTESLHTVLRVQELEAQNKTLLERGNDLQKEASDISEKLRHKDEQAVEAETRLSDLQTQLEGVRIEKAALEERGLAYETQSNAKLEQTKAELWKAANLDKAKVESNYQNQLHLLKQQKKEVDNALEQKVGQLCQLQVELSDTISKMDQLQAKHAAVVTQASQDIGLLAELKAEKAKEHKESVTSQARVAQLETEAINKTEHITLLEKELRLTKNDLEAKLADVQRLGQFEEELRVTMDKLDAKDRQIRKLMAANEPSIAANPIETTNPEDQEQPKRKANRAEKRLPSVVEDSQPKDMPISAAVKPVSTKSDKTSTPSRYCRLTDIARLSSPLEDLDDMLDDLGDLAEIFSPPPLPKPQGSESSREVASQDISIPHGKGQEEDSSKRLTSSRGSRSSIHKSIHFSVPSNRPTFTATSSVAQAQRADLSAQGSTQGTDGSRRQQTVSTQSSQQHSILKKSATVAKRSASIAGLSPSDSRSSNKRTRDLGPVIEDSQSPHGSRIPARNHRPAKMNSRKQPRDDKYSRRFSRELNPET